LGRYLTYSEITSRSNPGFQLLFANGRFFLDYLAHTTNDQGIDLVTKRQWQFKLFWKYGSSRWETTLAS
jgi:hypothetical protein